MMRRMVGIVAVFLLSGIVCRGSDFIPGFAHGISAYAVSEDGSVAYVAADSRHVFLRAEDGAWEDITERLSCGTTARILQIKNIMIIDQDADSVLISLAYSDNYYRRKTNCIRTVDGGATWNMVNPNGLNNANSTGHIVLDPRDCDHLRYFSDRHISESFDFGEVWVSRERQDDEVAKLIMDISYSKVNPDFVYYLGGMEIPSVWCYLWRRDSIWEDSKMLALNDTIFDYSFCYYKNIEALESGKVLARLAYEIGGDPIVANKLHGLLQSQEDDFHWRYYDNVGLPEYYYVGEIKEYGDAVLIRSEMNASSRGMYVSYDEGMNFEKCQGEISNSEIVNNFYVHPGTDDLFVSTGDQGVWKSEGDLSQWQNVDLIGIPQVAGAFPYVSENYIRTQIGYTTKLYDFRTESWHTLEPPFRSEDSVAVTLEPFFEDGDDLVFPLEIAEDYRLNEHLQFAKTSDLGTTWASFGPSSSPGAQLMSWLRAKYDVVQTPEGMKMAVVRGVAEGMAPLQVSVTSDTGRTWTFSTTINNYLDVALTADKLFMAAHQDEIYVSTNDGRTFSGTHFPDPQYIKTNYNRSRFVVNEETDDVYFFGLVHPTLEGVQVYRYRNDEWTALGQIPSIRNAVLIPGDPEIIVACASDPPDFVSYLVCTSNDCVTWNEVTFDCPGAEHMTSSVNGLCYDPWREKVWITTPVGLVGYDAAELRAAEDGDRLSAQPDHFVLDAIYPNPFNAQTTIAYTINRGNQVAIKCYDIQGRLVREVLDDYQTPGNYKAVLDGSQLASGTYFVRIKVGREVITRKIVMVK